MSLTSRGRVSGGFGPSPMIATGPGGAGGGNGGIVELVQQEEDALLPQPESQRPTESHDAPQLEDEAV